MIGCFTKLSFVKNNEDSIWSGLYRLYTKAYLDNSTKYISLILGTDIQSTRIIAHDNATATVSDTDILIKTLKTMNIRSHIDFFDEIECYMDKEAVDYIYAHIDEYLEGDEDYINNSYTAFIEDYLNFCDDWNEQSGGILLPALNRALEMYVITNIVAYRYSGYFTSIIKALEADLQYELDLADD